jgi:5-methylcytosine-specific restriction endonuclease McrA
MSDDTPVLDVCVDCATRFPRLHPKGVRRRCELCRRMHQKTRHRLYQPNRDRSSKPCEICAVIITPQSVGPVARWCRVCAVVVQRQQVELWAKTQPEYQRQKWQAHKQRRRAAKCKAEFEYFTSLEIYVRDRWRCGICSKFVDCDLRYPDPLSSSLDHIIPLACGGSHTRNNVQLAHLRCNCLKQDKVAYGKPI